MERKVITMPSIKSVPRSAALFGAAAALMSVGVAGVADAVVKPGPSGSGGSTAVTFATPADHALVTARAVSVRIGVGSRVHSGSGSMRITRRRQPILRPA